MKHNENLQLDYTNKAKLICNLLCWLQTNFCCSSPVMLVVMKVRGQLCNSSVIVLHVLCSLLNICCRVGVFDPLTCSRRMAKNLLHIDDTLFVSQYHLLCRCHIQHSASSKLRSKVFQHNQGRRLTWTQLGDGKTYHQFLFISGCAFYCLRQLKSLRCQLCKAQIPCGMEYEILPTHAIMSSSYAFTHHQYAISVILGGVSAVWALMCWVVASSSVRCHTVPSSNIKRMWLHVSICGFEGL